MGFEASNDALRKRMLLDMLKIRAVEDELERLYFRGLVRGSIHLCQGQEAVSVGTCIGREPGDTMTCTYRGHGAVLAMGANVEKVIAEVLGRETGLCKGQGGSMHLTDFTIGAMGSFAIVGANLPVSVGLAWGHHLREDGRVSIAFFGDGSTNIGAFHESLNLASLWRLPILLVCENNLYGEYSPITSTTVEPNLARRASGYGIEAQQVDGNDVFAVYEAATRAMASIRSGGGPHFIEALTYRQKGHSRSDPGKYRPQDEVDHWMARDPISNFSERLIADQVIDSQWYSSERERVRLEINSASESAVGAPYPPVVHTFGKSA